MKRIIASLLKAFSGDTESITTYAKAVKLLRHKDELAKSEHVHDVLLRTRIYSNMGNYQAIAQKANAVAEHVKSEPIASIPRIHVSGYATSQAYNMDHWITIDDTYATIGELFEFVQVWLYLSEVAQTIKSSIADYNVHSATPEMQRYKTIGAFVDNLEPIVITILEYIQCYQGKTKVSL
jgi:hypothetical protein